MAVAREPERTTMTRLERNVSLASIVIPALAFVLAIVLLWNRAINASYLAMLALMYVATAIGVTVGYHRLFTHRSFAAARPVQYALAIFGSMAGQGPLVYWVADHRKHHAYTDVRGDPHSPHVHDHGSGARGVVLGLVHAHFGWLMTDWGCAEHSRYARDLVEDRGLSLVSDLFALWMVLGLLVPTLAGYLLSGTLAGAALGLLWGGFVRVFLLDHVTWSINSVCHYHGRRRFDTDDESTNVFWLALPSLGEAWHHNHHAFPRSATHGLGRWELDPSAWVIGVLEKLGLASNVVRITPERQAEKLAGSES
jgi:stearoyl-CoA desaturase (delta-9 desaturase)